MIDLREIDETIWQLRHEGNTVAQAQKLALLYIARDHMLEEDAQKAPVMPEASYAANPQNSAPEWIVPDAVEDASDFLAVCKGRKIMDVLHIIDQHMEAIRLLYPKEYDKVVGMIMTNNMT